MLNNERQSELLGDLEHFRQEIEEARTKKALADERQDKEASAQLQRDIDEFNHTIDGIQSRLVKLGKAVGA